MNNMVHSSGWNNKFKTLLLLVLLSGLFMLIGGLVGGNSGITIAFMFALCMNGIAYFFSDKIVLAMQGAKPLDAEQHAPIFAMVRELSDSMQMPMPKLWLIQTDMANAFATGRNPANGSIAVTTGILEILEPHELRGVLAHEMAHIYNRDILVGTIAATIATAIGYVAHMVQNMFFWGALHGSNKKESSNIFGMLIVAILMPIAATILQLSISRSREYLADETGAHTCHDPLALASALQKLHAQSTRAAHQDASRQDTYSTGMASLFIVKPFTGKGLVELFSTHPPLEKRIAKLHRIYETQGY